ncbi:methyltransferase, FxLD system [Phytohabitans aurantiacus]|uniref:Protein-L-isoaspartate O-methyltransferase n=1 Tax=Phytohabitans aurantiacus TaxID=3016789 RepID=A0ABQ5R2C9_9ACTN|nr:methyltransferase, FxLD system [Phytohabitans aurantiacus]GLI00939.1 O-methyltransferase [Phytohabitans aurantiacus]
MEPGTWPQAIIEFADRDRRTAERVAVDHLHPALATARANGSITEWFFIRKGPCWRLRYRPTGHSARAPLERLLDKLASERHICGWTAGIYEPEEVAFGGSAGMTVAHELFDRDSRHVLDYLSRQPVLGRRELGVLLCSALMRAAGLDWYEQGDVWARVGQHRPGTDEPPAARLNRHMRHLMTVDVHPLVTVGPLATIDNWIAAYERAGHQLADLARTGVLERGIRAVLTHHVLFSWNRLGLPATEQSTLARLAREVIMGEPDDAVSTTGASVGPTRVGTVTTDMTEKPVAEHAAELRDALVSKLHEQGTVHTASVEAALRAVPRHVFLPQVPIEQAYADEPVYTKHDGAVSISAASQPTIVAMMLEQLQVESGNRILEIGAATGYNAALLAYLAGQGGHVTTIDVDEDLVDGARAGLEAAGIRNVRVVLGDGALGYPPDAPYDRIIATVGAWGTPPPAWQEQLAPHGRLVAPLRIRGSISRSIVFEHDGPGHWRSSSSQMCSFMPLRGGVADDPRRLVTLADEGVIIQAHQEQAVDEAALEGVLRQPGGETWTSVRFRGQESMEWMDLYLTLSLDTALSRMTVQPSAVDSGMVEPQFGWGAMATVDKSSLAYLTLRSTPAPDGTGRLYEVGVIGHGPDGDQLTSRVADAIRTWDQDYRTLPVEFELLPSGVRAPAEDAPGTFVVATPHNDLIVSWR